MSVSFIKLLIGSPSDKGIRKNQQVQLNDDVIMWNLT